MISLEHVSVTFKEKNRIVEAVKDVSLTIDKGDVFGVVGFSGAGKSTLVRTINLLQPPTSGKVVVAGADLLSLSKSDLRKARTKIGMIFQHFNLMHSRTVFDNIAYPIKKSHTKDEINKKVSELLDLVGMADKRDSYPSQLSGGQKQRVAIARALANDPEILLCDEATSALDPQTTLSILDLLKDLNQTLQLTIVLITHEMQVVKEICNKVAIMELGRVVEQSDIVSIFSNPKEELTQKFINTATHIEQGIETILDNPDLLQLNPEDVLAKISYVGKNTTEPIISQLFSLFGVSTNILTGNIEILQQTPIGTLVVAFSGEKESLLKAFSYLSDNNVGIQEIKINKTGFDNITILNKYLREA
ncbi:MAG: ATP-binding cassette domain-containing protein [Clostridioides sp.]|jgi:D-methionine transport system ATP-binding protein|nr:ATP-binding cassette domain-containing protein [Clostridioides sp.]